MSSSRYQKSKDRVEHVDESGDVAVSLIEEAGHLVSARSLIPDDQSMIRKEAKDFLRSGDDVLLFTGGTGVARADVTVEAVKPSFEKELDGFGELLRRRSFDEIGTSAMLTRATAGVSRGKLMLCLPGSPGAVRMALKLTIDEFPHIIRVARQ